MFVVKLRSLLSSPFVFIQSQSLYRNILTCCLKPVSVPNSNYVKFALSKWQQHPNQKAVIHASDGRFLTYEALVQQSQLLATALINASDGRNPKVLTFMKNSPEIVLLYCAVGLSNGILSPANSSYTAAELRHQIQDSQSQIIFADKECYPTALKAVESLPFVKKVILTNGISSQEGEHLATFSQGDGGEEVKVYVHSEDEMTDWSKRLAILPYSSGTTGLPKGVMLSHTNLNVNMLQEKAVTDKNESQVSLCLLPLYHIYGIRVIMCDTLYHGGTLITMDKFDKKVFFDVSAKYQITFLPLVPPILFGLLGAFNAAESGDLHLQRTLCDSFSNLKYVYSGAAALDGVTEKKLVHSFQKLSPSVSFCQGYGLTEAGPVVTAQPSMATRKPNKYGSVGTMLPNMEVKVVSTESGEEVGPNQPGELLVRGPNVMQSYLNKDKTEGFKNDWLMTGDIVYYDEDQYFYVVDRSKELIKYKALQVAPAELEGVLINHPDVEDCAVVGKPHPHAGEVPTAFVQLKNPSLAGQEIADALVLYVSERVADFKRLRGGVHFVNSIPKSASGKILRRNLKEKL